MTFIWIERFKFKPVKLKILWIMIPTCEINKKKKIIFIVNFGPLWNNAAGHLRQWGPPAKVKGHLQLALTIRIAFDWLKFYWLHKILIEL